MSRPIVYPLDGVKVWQVEDSLSKAIEKALDFQPRSGSRYETAGMAVVLVSLFSALACVVYAAVTRPAVPMLFILLAAIVGIGGSTLGMRIIDTPKKRLQMRADIKRDAVQPQLVSEHSPIFKAIMAPKLVDWLEGGGAADGRLKDDVRFALSCYYVEALQDTKGARIRLSRLNAAIDPADVAQAWYDYSLVAIDAAERFIGELASMTPVWLGDFVEYLAVAREEAKQKRKIELRSLMVQSDKEKQRIKKLLDGR